MMTELNAEIDFEMIADRLESVKLHQRESNKPFSVGLAYRQQVTAQEMVSSGGNALQATAVWHLQLPDGQPAPQVGDVVIDSQGNRWTILQTEQLVALGRWSCTTRELRLVYGCHEHVDVLRPVWGDIGSGPEIVDWTEVCAALPVNIRLDEMLLDTSTTPPTKQLFYEIILGESITLEPDDRFVAENGVSYRLNSLEQAERIDALPIAKASLEGNS